MKLIATKVTKLKVGDQIQVVCEHSGAIFVDAIEKIVLDGEMDFEITTSITGQVLTLYYQAIFPVVVFDGDDKI